MGWYADVDWNLTFPNADALNACAKDIRAQVSNVTALAQAEAQAGYPSNHGRLDDLARWTSPEDSTLIYLLLREFNEEGDIEVSEPDENGAITVSGWGGGKAWVTLMDTPQFTRHDGQWGTFSSFNGGLGLGDILAAHATGTADWVGEDHDRWRWRFYGDGTWAEHQGVITYPTDTGK